MHKSFLAVVLLLIMIFTSQGHLLALKPSRIYVAIPDTMRLPYEKNTITTSDNVHLKSWTFLPAKEHNNNTTLVMAYADAGNMSWWLSYAAIMSQVGYTVVLFDYRGFGESDDFSINPDMLYYNEFADDLSAVVKFAKEKYKPNKTGIWCFSMGSIITTIAAKTAMPDFIIGDSYVTDPVSIKEYYAGKKVINLPPGATNYTGLISALHMPMLIFSGTTDLVTPQSSIKALKEKIPSLQIVSYEGGHMQAFGTLTDRSKYLGSGYAAAVYNFLSPH